MGWSVALCSCNRSLDWDRELIQRALGLAEPPALYDRLPRDESHRFVDGLAARPVDRLLVACCGPADYFREVAGAAGVPPERVVVLSLGDSPFWPPPNRADANARAARALRAAMHAHAADAATRPELPVKVGPSVLIATDSRAGLDLARRLADVGRPRVFLDPRSAAFDRGPFQPPPWRTGWGVVVDVQGALGGFQVTVERAQPIDLEACVQCRRCIPVCHTAAISDGLRLRPELCDQCGDCLSACGEVGAITIPRRQRETVRADQVVLVTEGEARVATPRTGCHVLRRPVPGDVDALAWKVFGLMGEFRKPRYVAYDPDTCAGGAAGHQACGRCVGACPYTAIARDPRNPLRVQVDDAACEGCGACVATCPTSSLSFTDPPPAVVRARLAGLLAPLGTGAGGTPVVAFHCPEQGARTLAQAAGQRHPYPAAVLPMPMACLRHVSEADLLAAFRFGAAGVALLGCETCPHGARQSVDERLALVRRMLDAFGIESERLQMIAGEGPGALGALDAFARSWATPAVAWGGPGDPASPDHREAIADVIGRLLDATGREPGRLAVPATAPFAVPEIRVGGCTLCRTCVNVCPTHAFRFDESPPALSLRAVSCVNCGLCATACPESVIALRAELPLERAALEHRVVVQDETLRCTRCAAPFGNRRAVEVLEGKLFGMAALGDTFTGSRRGFLRMCPNCRAVAAMQEMDRGWQP
jgi:ferredoxin